MCHKEIIVQISFCLSLYIAEAQKIFDETD